jgi:dTDP-4-dehydrorhamnose reductase
MLKEPSNVELVIGGTGFLGAHLVEALVAAGRRVLVAARRKPADAGIKLPKIAGFHRVEDWSATESKKPRQRIMLSAIGNGQFARVWHLAAMSRAADAERDPDAAESVNCDWPAAIAKAARQNATPLIHISTDLVFGANPAPEGGFAPTDLIAPVCTYGQTKARGEQVVRRKYDKADIVRLPLLFGNSHRRALGASDALLAMLERGEQPQLFTDEWRTPLDVGAAAKALIALDAALRAEPDRRGDVWHFGGRRLSRLELGCALLARSGLSPELLVPTTRAALGLQAKRAADASLDSSATRALSETLQITLESGSAPSFP